MGMDHKVTFTGERTPSWRQLREFLYVRGLEVKLRMIDGQLAFPDEEPSDGWQELRVATPQGMVTLRREPDGIRLVIWGNADLAMRQTWNALTWAVALLSAGSVETPSGSQSADDFARTSELLAAIRGGPS